MFFHGFHQKISAFRFAEELFLEVIMIKPKQSAAMKFDTKGIKRTESFGGAKIGG